MFSGVSHSYSVEVAALWGSFLPAFTVVALIVGAQIEKAKRRATPVRVVVRSQTRLVRE